ncbi:toxin-antitoxin system YwqK family antitoxin [Aquimarina sp. RZ0]|uniref:toxin-antitoxin system YwqK family antitoxin n=1 Tax=Aquimarina sp. RZ0 TaxID=2607730 RepID=UPI0011F25007|nr:hypothetical protein [Aquimarina sp. RZ0]KAA1242641.1 hypothetical protein F0000_24620 [Aquimarina sp. RZ0]
MKQIILFFLHFMITFTALTQELNTLKLMDDQSKLSSEISKSKKIIEKRYYISGELKEIRETIDGKLTGNWKLYHKNGKLKKEGNFYNAAPHGTWKIYNKKGKLVFIENYEKGIEHGIWKTLHPNGEVKIEGEFIQGKRQGNWNIYDYSGKTKKIVVFEDDMEKSELLPENSPIEIDLFSHHQSLTNF